MKRILKWMLLFTLLLSLSGCGDSGGLSDTASIAQQESQNNAADTTTQQESQDNAADTTTQRESQDNAADAMAQPDSQDNVTNLVHKNSGEEEIPEQEFPDTGTEKSQGNPTSLPEASTFEIHFIDVGQADAALVLCDGQAMLIDGGNVEDSSLVYTYLKDRELKYLDYIICTHAHEDHVGGLAGALNYATAGTALCPVTEYDSKAFQNFVSYLEKQGLSITVPAAGDSFSLGSASVQILGPVNLETEETNNTSIVLKIVYGKTSFLFTGDAQREEEQDILDAGYDLDSTVLKVGHHGSADSTTYPFLREIMPEYAVISVGADNSYGHPTEEALSRLRDADVKVFRTDMQGDIICTSDGENVSFSVERNPEADTLSAARPDNHRQEEASVPANNANPPEMGNSSPKDETSGSNNSSNGDASENNSPETETGGNSNNSSVAETNEGNSPETETGDNSNNSPEAETSEGSSPETEAGGNSNNSSVAETSESNSPETNSSDSNAALPEIAEENVPAPAGTDYILNTNTHKFHYPQCSSVNQMKESNKLFYTGTRDEVIAMGYDPCKRCNP